MARTGRPIMPIGGHGAITPRKLEDGGWQARTRFRDLDGVTRQVSAHGRTKPAALQALNAKLRDRARMGGADLSAESTVAELAESWFAGVDESPGTRDTYRGLLDSHILPRLGNNRLREVTTGRVEQFVNLVAKPTTKQIVAKNGRPMTVRSGGPTAARMSRTVLALMFALAVRHDAVPANPVRESRQPVVERKEVRALTPEEFVLLRQNILAWQDSGVMGPRKSKDLIDKVDMFVATGLRPGELLGLLWEDVNFDASPVTIAVTGTIKRTSVNGLHRQAFPKSVSGERVLPLPQFAVKVLARRKLADDPARNPMGLIFPSAVGGVLDPGNFRRQWVEARGPEFDWVKPGGFRKAVATLIEREADSVVASRQLGHSSDAVTRRYYIARDHMAPDSTHILDQFGVAE